MPFPKQEYAFNLNTLLTVKEIGAVYGLFKSNPIRPGYFVPLYVGETDNLRRRLLEHYNNPPVAGATHFFAEISPVERQRLVREQQLIAEFNPIGNKTLGG